MHPTCRTYCSFRCFTSIEFNCNFIVHIVTRRIFSSSFLLIRPLGLSCSFSPTSVCVLPTRVFFRDSWGTQAPQVGRSQGRNQGQQATPVVGYWGSIWNAWILQADIKKLGQVCYPGGRVLGQWLKCVRPSGVEHGEWAAQAEWCWYNWNSRAHKVVIRVSVLLRLEEEVMAEMH